MLSYPKIKLISDIVKEEEITIREEDLVPLKGDRLHGIFRFMDTDLISLAEVRAAGELEGRAIFLNTITAEPKIVIDSEGSMCLIFIKKRS